MMILNNVRAFKVCNEGSFLLCMYFMCLAATTVVCDE